MENTFISFGFLVSLIGVIANGPGDLTLEADFANTYDSNVFVAATTDSRTRCERAWTVTEDNNDNKLEGVDFSIEAYKTIRFSSSLNHADIQNLSLLRCQLSYKLARTRTYKTWRSALLFLWLSDVDESGLTYVLKTDPGGSGKLDIIEKINIPEGNLAFQIHFSYSHSMGFFTPAQGVPAYRCNDAWEYSFKGPYPRGETFAFARQKATVILSPVLELLDITDMLFTKCVISILRPGTADYSADVFWLSEGEGEDRSTYILKMHDAVDGLKIVDRMIID